MSDVQMPRLSDSMEEGTVLKWLKAPGDAVSRGDDLVEIETDKATMTFQAEADGVLEIIAREGDTLAIGAPIARLGREGSSPAGAPPAAAPPAPASRDASAPAAVQGTPPGVAASDDRVKVSPIARRIARERGIDLAGLSGSGPGGRIVKADVEGETTDRPAAPAPVVARPVAAPVPPATAGTPGAPGASGASGAPGALTGKGAVTVQEPTRAQQVVARRMSSSKATIPEFTLAAEIDMARCVELRGRLKTLHGDRPVASYNDIVVKACGVALAEHPRANGSWRDGRFELYSRVNIGVAVAGDGVLVVPTVFDADRRPLEEIAAETRRLAQRVRDGAVTPPELSGATFTVSNLGMFGVKSFTAVINPPQAAILAVGAVTARPVVRDGAVVAGHAMDVTLACDHRILYGADAAAFLARIRELLEEPLALLR